MKQLEDWLRSAFAGMTQGPGPLSQAVEFYSGKQGAVAELDSELLRRLKVGPNDEVRRLLNDQLKVWDWESEAPWVKGTAANTASRRVRIYALLKVNNQLREGLDQYVPPYKGGTSVMIAPPDGKQAWYSHDFRRKHDFYWRHLRKYLKDTKNLDGDTLNALNSATSRVLERLGDPSASVSKVARGLVIGHVQSGKTTHFTSVIAKAIDAGYRLIIVLSGTTNLLRNQTQRRLDMELVGKENILRGTDESEVDHGYKEDEAWPEGFISYGKQPSLLNQPDIIRLTGQQDFETINAGLSQFEFEKKDRFKPLFDRENLDHTGARIVIVKKQRDRLKRLLQDLKTVGAGRCSEIPVLVIDDESDQASVNTLKPTPTGDKSRSKINEAIVMLLKRLPRAQYVGYTATPIASVFTNPSDPVDIYPRDFILSLEAPPEYMGAKAFHDFEGPQLGTLSNEAAHVRDISPNANPENDRLTEALDAFVLSGALKKFRESTKTGIFRHHTMLVHESQFTVDQESAVSRLRALWSRAGYESPGAGLKRLEALLEGDFRPVWADRGTKRGYRFPKTFRDLIPYVGKSLDEIRRNGPILMVNSAEGSEVPTFDKKSGVWKIIVGGAKLSRGYTIEGLTISYFRRRAKMQDTLMQMGRWFGYRLGYRDLVRLYIGRGEKDGKQQIDLYKAFEAICKDEEDFRAQLVMYEGDNGVTPRDVPALVFNSHPQLRPTARNRMFNAVLVWASFKYREPTSQAVDSAGKKHNAQEFAELLSQAKVRSARATQEDGGGVEFEVKWTEVSDDRISSLLASVRWDRGQTPIRAELEFMRLKKSGVKSWRVLLPQLKNSGVGGVWRVGKNEFRCITRHRFDTRFGVYSDPLHRQFARWLIGDTEWAFRTSELTPSDQMGVLLVYPTYDKEKPVSGLPVMGFAMLLPGVKGSSKRVAFTVKAESKPDDIIVST